MSDPSKGTRLRFRDDAELCSYHEGAILDTGVCRKEIWYQQADLSHQKRKALAVSKEAHRYGFGSLLSGTYGKSGDEIQHALNTWSRNGSNRRGLERWINNEYAAKRSDIRKRTIQSVLRAQEKIRHENISSDSYTEKVLSRLSEAFSQDSVKFAHAMGKADQLAIVETEEDKWAAIKNAPPRAPARTYSPTSVLIIPPRRRNLGLSNISNDFRHFY